MPTFTLHNNSLEYEPSDVINFAEGLIGLPGLRRLALVRQPEIDPFLWLAALDVDGMAFLVVEPRSLFPDYELPEYDAQEELLLALVKLEPEWTATTVNLRAPLIINRANKCGRQTVLTETPYKLDEHLPDTCLAA